MMRNLITIIAGFFLGNILLAQEKTIEVFKNELINFSDTSSEQNQIIRLQKGRVIVKKIKAPEYKKGTDVNIQVKVRSNGDRWDKSGSCFVVKDLKTLNVIDIAMQKKSFPKSASVQNSNGVIKSENYQPAVELLRFMTPFGVGFYSDESKFPNTRYSRPVSVPNWEKEVAWEQDISQLETLVTEEFYIGVWIDTWTQEGYRVDVSLSYSGRERSKKTIIPLVNTIYYIDGQSIPTFFAFQSLKMDFSIPKNISKAEIYYITTGHGGHSGGDEFVKKTNRVLFDNKEILNFIPWRDDCAAFRRFNPTSGVWIQKDTAMFYDEQGKRTKGEVIERLASSDLSRSNWCPGSAIIPEKVQLNNINKGNHTLEIHIPAAKNTGDQQNHWLVSAYLAY